MPRRTEKEHRLKVLAKMPLFAHLSPESMRVLAEVIVHARGYAWSRLVARHCGISTNSRRSLATLPERKNPGQHNQADHETSHSNLSSQICRRTPVVLHVETLRSSHLFAAKRRMISFLPQKYGAQVSLLKPPAPWCRYTFRAERSRATGLFARPGTHCG